MVAALVSVRPPGSAEFVEFAAAQRQVNAFFWSSEFAYELVRQQVLTADLRQDSRRIDTIFADIRCNAFKPGAKARRTIAAGRNPMFRTKYHADVAQFERDLRNNLEQVCRHVIVRFYSALERFLVDRADPFLQLAGLPPEKRERKRNTFAKKRCYEMEAYLRELGAPLRNSVPSDIAVVTQACRELRNHVIHREQEGWQPPWTDTEFRETITQRFNKDDTRLIMKRLCDNARRQADKQSDVPLLFFYALFSLTDLRRFAEAMEAALP